MFKPSKKNSQAFLVSVMSFCQQCPQNLHQRALVVEMYIKTNQPSIHPAAAESPSPKAAKRRRHLHPIHQTFTLLHFRVLQPGMVNDEKPMTRKPLKPSITEGNTVKRQWKQIACQWPNLTPTISAPVDVKTFHDDEDSRELPAPGSRERGKIIDFKWAQNQASQTTISNNSL